MPYFNRDDDMATMRDLIALTERDTAIDRIWQNARYLESEIKYLDADPAIKAKLTRSIHQVTEYLDELYKSP